MHYYQALKEELNITTQQLAHLETRHEDLDYDIDNLVNLIGTARATGKWEVTDLIGFLGFHFFYYLFFTIHFFYIGKRVRFVVCRTPD